MLAPGRSRTAASGRLVIATAWSVAANGADSSTRGCAVVVVVPTTWSSKTPTAATRNDSGTASFRSALPSASFGIPIRCSTLPGRRCSRLASVVSITAWPRRPGRTSAPR